ncbi:hypothetical protein [Streptomyces sp. NPDC047841]|uniref:hypothetical protein n=1 Tax=Streptomyces sp. NPDC047841 TaxID=3154708 RepID=UPI003454233B
MPAGKAIASVAMPTAVLMGMGFTSTLALADNNGGPSPSTSAKSLTADEYKDCVKALADGSKDPSATPSPSASPSTTAAPSPSETTGSGKTQDAGGTSSPDSGSGDENTPAPTATSGSSGSGSGSGSSDSGSSDSGSSGSGSAGSGTSGSGSSGSGSGSSGSGSGGDTTAGDAATQTGSGGGTVLDTIGDTLGDTLGDLLTGGGKGSGTSSQTPAPAPSASQSATQTPDTPSTDTPSGGGTKPGGDTGSGGGTKPGGGTGSGGTSGSVEDTVKKATDTVQGTVDGTAGTVSRTAKDAAKTAGDATGSATPSPSASESASADDCPVATDDQGGVDNKVLVADDPWYLNASSLLLKGADYQGIVEVKTAGGTTKKALKYVISGGTDIGDLHQTVKDAQAGKTYHVQAAKGSTSTITGGDTVMYTESISGNLFGLIPVTFSPDSPPPLNIPLIYFTNVKVVQAAQFGGNLHVPGMHVYTTD